MSTPATTPTDFWLRAYQLTVQPTNASKAIVVSSSTLEPNSLRIKFDISMHVGQPLWWGEISVYNLAQDTMNVIIQPGSVVQLQAGYQTGSHAMATIFEGKVFQPIWRREAVVDWVLTLQCYSGNAKNFINTAFSRGQTQADLVNLIASTARYQMHVGHIDPLLNQVTLPRGGVLLGDPNKILGDLASQHNLTLLYDHNGINIADLGSLQSGELLVPNHAPYAPPIAAGSGRTPTSGEDYCLIGDVEQTWEGVNFTVLLDPSLKIKYPPDVVKIDMSSTTINLLPLPNPAFGNDGGFVPPPSPKGTYIVAGVRHYGDSRATPWYSEICAVTQNGLLLALGNPQ